MNNEKLLDIIKNVQNKSNKDLIDTRQFLYDEFEKTKELIIDLTRHLDNVQDMYDVINDEIGKRTKGI